MRVTSRGIGKTAVALLGGYLGTVFLSSYIETRVQEEYNKIAMRPHLELVVNGEKETVTEEREIPSNELYWESKKGFTFLVSGKTRNPANRGIGFIGRDWSFEVGFTGECLETWDYNGGPGTNNLTRICDRNHDGDIDTLYKTDFPNKTVIDLRRAYNYRALKGQYAEEELIKGENIIPISTKTSMMDEAQNTYSRFMAAHDIDTKIKNYQWRFEEKRTDSLQQ